jgi:glucose-6-phosphate isomerase
MRDLPFTFTLPLPGVIPSRVDNHVQRRLSALRGQFLDQETYAKMLAKDDELIYEVYEIKRPEVEGELIMGVSIVHPGKVGREFHMTKGHFHSVLETSEIYYCLR